MAVSNIGAAVEAVAVAEDAAAEDLVTFIAAAEVSSRIRTRITRTITTQTFRIEVTIRVVVFDRITISIVTRTEDSAEDKNFQGRGPSGRVPAGRVPQQNNNNFFYQRGRAPPAARPPQAARLPAMNSPKPMEVHHFDQTYEQWDYSTEQNDYQQTQEFEQQTSDYEQQHYEQDQDQQGWYWSRSYVSMERLLLTSPNNLRMYGCLGTHDRTVVFTITVVNSLDTSLIVRSFILTHKPWISAWF